MKKEEKEDLGSGDLERLVVEWKSLLDLIVYSPDLELERWTHLQEAACKIVGTRSLDTELPQLPKLSVNQRRRFERRVRDFR